MTFPRPALAALAVMLVVLIAPSGAWAADEGDDPNLDQQLDSTVPIVSEPAVLSAGHVDFGPRFVDGEWTLLIHDDAARTDPATPSVWRHPDSTVLHLTDAAELPVPDDPAYAFLGVDPGATVHVIPQTQNPQVVWAGWNTQDPEVMASIDRGATFALDSLTGPGELIVYLQSGSFGEPEVLWDSRAEANPVWVDVNTHTHANWVFTEPGVYLAEFTVTADLIDGTTVSDSRELRFAVGDGTDPRDALAAATSDDPVTTAPAAEPATGTPEDPLSIVLVIAIVVVAVLLAAGVVVALVRGGRAKRRALGDAR